MKRIPEKELREVLLDAAREETAQIENAGGEIPVPASLIAATDAMVALDQAAARRRRSLRRVIAAAAAVLLLVFFVVPVSAGGKTSASYLIEQFEKGSFFHPKKNGQNAPDSIVTFYTIDAPEGYTLVERKTIYDLKKIISAIAKWSVGGKQILLKQTLIGIQFTVDTENVVHEKIDRNGYTVYYYYKNGMSYALWLTEEYQFFLLADDTDKEAFFAIMDTLRELTPEELETFERV